MTVLLCPDRLQSSRRPQFHYPVVYEVDPSARSGPGQLASVLPNSLTWPGMEPGLEPVEPAPGTWLLEPDEYHAGAVGAMTKAVEDDSDREARGRGAELPDAAADFAADLAELGDHCGDKLQTIFFIKEEVNKPTDWGPEWHHRAALGPEPEPEELSVPPPPGLPLPPPPGLSRRMSPPPGLGLDSEAIQEVVDQSRSRGRGHATLRIPMSATLRRTLIMMGSRPVWQQTGGSGSSVAGACKTSDGTGSSSSDRPGAQKGKCRRRKTDKSDADSKHGRTAASCNKSFQAESSVSGATALSGWSAGSASLPVGKRAQHEEIVSRRRDGNQPEQPHQLQQLADLQPPMHETRGLSELPVRHRKKPAKARERPSSIFSSLALALPLARRGMQTSANITEATSMGV
eukprot:gb/GFBE01032441.1/.p1 GENE.gb/GFBE01032441.1/~~gb/GFBE01032441.1/.p1  ORF type:complete len:402 (+),score=63.22 gb/GFBE01032441.1/:1-1206(+)